MKRFVGENLVMREVELSGPVQNCQDRYEISKEQHLGADSKKPETPGRYIEVTVIRNFRVTQVVDYRIEELD